MTNGCDHAARGAWLASCPGCKPATEAPKLDAREETLSLLFSRMARAGVIATPEQAQIFARLPDRALLSMLAKYSAVAETLGPMNDETYGSPIA